MKNGSPPRPPAAASAPEPSDRTEREPLDWPAQAGAGDDVLREILFHLKRRRRRRLTAVSVSAALLVIAGLIWRVPLRNGAAAGRPLPPSVVVSTPARQSLSDGSIVEWKNGARIRVAFTDAVRHVVLERGEAHFQVAKHQPRPFVVSAGGVEFRAVGTAFSVSLGAEKVEMLVTEGRVSVDRGHASSDALPPGLVRTLATAGAGQQVVVDLGTAAGPAPTVDTVSALEMARRLAWRAPKLEFSATPLSEVVAMINRYTGDRPKIRLILGDSSLASVRLTGILRADNVETLIGLLATDYGIRAERHDTEIVLRSAR